MLLLRQGTFTSLVHARAGRTHNVAADGIEISVVMQWQAAAAEHDRVSMLSAKGHSVQPYAEFSSVLWRFTMLSWMALNKW